MKKAAGRSDWKDGFLFVGNQLALDFLNTRPVQNGEPSELLHDVGALLHWFQAADLLSSREADSLQRQWGGSVSAQKVTEAMRQLRERLRKDILAWERNGSLRHSTLNELNKLMAQHPLRSRLRAIGKSYSMELWFEPREPRDLFAPLAHSAAALFATADRERVHKCAQCVLHFHDTSKKGTRRWCSMRLCGNRLKVAAYAARRDPRARKRHDHPKRR
jgi:predicted RNA-binding Zn ribbon-like protein